MSSALPLVLFDSSKDETHTVDTGLTELVSSLKYSYEVGSNQIDTSAGLPACSVFVFADPKSDFSGPEVTALDAHLQSGRSVLITTDERRATQMAGGPLGEYLTTLGISIQPDNAIVNSVYTTEFHPKNARCIRCASLSALEVALVKEAQV
ncbi:hypothetical protein KIPB_006857 [Kipferlia bialata]|uniref:IFT52 GIFT domain-containing protein n=1 Tax=Kipferlia bialata TaxID=797122 RepID=A0A9K3CZG4_9EUKA|nr:hypothetical protein KIPB_006857 [Kipferlia bialata]|eukprot:g6857.t1